MIFLRFFFISIFLLGACQNPDVAVYRVPKETRAVAVEAGGASARGLGWTLPKGWVEQPASSMRVASFLATGPRGHQVDVSVVSLAGQAGGLLDNVNRWRGQINLPPLTQGELPAMSKRVSPAKRPMVLVNFVSRENLILDKFKKRLVAAVYSQGETTWFFKMTGEDETVRWAEPAFLQFLESLRFEPAAPQ